MPNISQGQYLSRQSCKSFETTRFIHHTSSARRHRVTTGLSYLMHRVMLLLKLAQRDDRATRLRIYLLALGFIEHIFRTLGEAIIILIQVKMARLGRMLSVANPV